MNLKYIRRYKNKKFIFLKSKIKQDIHYIFRQSQCRLRLFTTDMLNGRQILLALLTRLRLPIVKTSIPISQNFGNSQRVRRNSPTVDSYTFICEYRERIVREQGSAFRLNFRPETTIIQSRGAVYRHADFPPPSVYVAKNRSHSSDSTRFVIQ